MMWTRMPGQSWASAAAGFLAMWIMMMVIMMLPSLIPMLRGYRRAVRTTAPATATTTATARLGLLTMIVSAGYFLVWLLPGTVAFPVGAVIAEIAARGSALTRVLPLLSAAVVLLAGAYQFTGWKTRSLLCCRNAMGRNLFVAGGTGPAWQHGVSLGTHCVLSCGNLMAAALATGLTDLRAMLVIAAIITAERVAPAGIPVARVCGVLVMAGGAFLIAPAVGFR
jgi:predicted metal-binding membrane protein